MIKDVDLKKPLTPAILSDQNHSFVKMLIYIYTMETFIFKEMNNASRNKDAKKIQLYGPFASALSFIIYVGRQNQSKSIKSKKDFYVYRGLPLTLSEIETKYRLGSVINLQGYTSSTLSKQNALEFAFERPKAPSFSEADPNLSPLSGARTEVIPESQLPVLIQIKVSSKSKQYFSLVDSYELSAYPTEEEIVLQDGASYKVIDRRMIKSELDGLPSVSNQDQPSTLQIPSDGVNYSDVLNTSSSNFIQNSRNYMLIELEMMQDSYFGRNVFQRAFKLLTN